MDDNNKKYEKFLVLFKKQGHPSNAIPWTGIDPTIEFIKEKLEEGYAIQVKPFSKDDWSKG